MKYVDVVIDNQNDNTDTFYTYACDYENVRVGDKVYVPFARGNRRREAYVFAVAEEPPQGVKGMKSIEQIDEEVSLDEKTMAVCQWMRKRYLCRYIDAVKCFTPAGSSSKRGKIRTPYKDAQGEYSAIRELTAEQKNALRQMEPALANYEHKTFLIHGVTSSGKTEIYMQMIEQCINQKRGALMLVPEISLTKQTIDRFIGRFGAERDRKSVV